MPHRNQSFTKPVATLFPSSFIGTFSRAITSRSPQSQHNGHCFTILCASYQQRQACIAFLHEYGIQAVFHYQPLHRAPVWQGAFDAVELPVTEEVAATILRLPMHFYLTVQDVDAVCDALATFFTG